MAGDLIGTQLRDGTDYCSKDAAAFWRTLRWVVFKIEKPYNQLTHMYTFIATNMEELGDWQVIDYYCSRGRMENFIGEGNRALILRP